MATSRIVLCLASFVLLNVFVSADDYCTTSYYGNTDSGSPHTMDVIYLSPSKAEWKLTIPGVCLGSDQRQTGLKVTVCDYPAARTNIYNPFEVMIYRNAYPLVTTASVYVTTYCESSAVTDAPLPTLPPVYPGSPILVGSTYHG